MNQRLGIILLSMSLAQGLDACEIRVRDAAFRTPRDVHRLCVIANREDAAADKIQAELEKWLAEEAEGLNIRVERINADDPETDWSSLGVPGPPAALPVTALIGHSNSSGENFVIDHWEPSPDEADLAQLLMSPVRKKLQEQLGKHLAVLLYFGTDGDSETRTLLRQLTKEPIKDERIGLGLIEVDPSDSQERLLLSFAGFDPASGNGLYTLEAATGRLLWQFRAAPIERLINVYGALSSTWLVNTGVLVHDGIAYCAAGIIDHDGTYVYALDAKTGEIIWQNNSSGHLNKKLRKGVSVQGNLTIRKDQLLMAGGNQVSPAAFDLKTGKSLARPIQQGRPQANNGKSVGVFQDTHAIVGGRILYSSPQNVATKGSFALHGEKGRMTLNWGGIAPAWSDETVVLVNYRNGKLTCCDADKVKQRVAEGYIKRPGNQRRRRANLADSFVADGPRWQTDLGEPNKFETVSLAIAANAAIAVVQQQQKYRAQLQRYVLAFDSKTGRTIWRHELFEEPIPGGLLIDRDGSVVVTTLNGSVVSFSANP